MKVFLLFTATDQELETRITETLMLAFVKRFREKYKDIPHCQIYREKEDSGFTVRLLKEWAETRDYNIDIEDEGIKELTTRDVYNELSRIFPVFNKNQLIKFRKEVLRYYKEMMPPDVDKKYIYEAEIKDCEGAINFVEKTIPDAIKRVSYSAYLNDYNNYLKQEIKGDLQSMATLNNIFNGNAQAIQVIKDALNDLLLSKTMGDNAITGFIVAAKEKEHLPSINDTVLLKAIFNEIGREIKKNTKPRYDKNTYSEWYKKTLKYFG